jgi:tripartite-type tricarboxylate transporter receptor subunit TctC
MDRRTALTGLLAAGACPALLAQPAPLTVLVGYNAGAVPDSAARLVGRHLGAQQNRNVIVDNRPGAGGQLALTALKNGPATGTMAALTPASPLTLFASTYKKLPYAPMEDFAPVCTVCSTDFAFAVPANHPARTLAEFIQWAKGKPAGGGIGNPGMGTAPHFLAWNLRKAAGFDLPDVPYRNPPQIALEVAAGDLAAGIASSSLFSEFVKAGKLRVLATSGVQRSTLYPQVPTFAQAGYESIRAQEWYVLVMKQGVPSSALAALHDAVSAITDIGSYRDSMLALGMQPQVHGPDWARDHLVKDTARWQDIVAKSGFVAE